MRLRRHLARHCLATSARLLAVALPLALAAQATRLAPLLAAAGAPARPTATLVAGALALVALALAPPVLGAGTALALARFAADGGVRALATHGVAPVALARSLRPLALLAALVVGTLGVLAEPPLARSMRGAARDLVADGLAGTLARGGQVEPVPGVVVAAPRGRGGPLVVARVASPGAAPDTLVARRFDVAVGDALTVALRGVDAELPGGHVTAARVALTAPLPDAPEDVIAADLTVPVTTRSVAAARRHAARWVWGVAAYVAVVLAAALALGGAPTATRVALAAALPVAATVVLARAGALAAAAARSATGAHGSAAVIAAVAVGVAELVARRVAAGRRRML